MLSHQLLVVRIGQIKTGGRIVPKDPILGNEHRAGGLGVSEEQRIMAYTKPDSDVEFSLFVIVYFCLSVSILVKSKIKG